MLRDLKDFSLPEIEERVLKFWKENNIFDKSIKKNKGKKKFVFYEGPPTANARPGIHHVLARVFKDIIPRYKTMVGFYVPRKGGWDTHGLPVELEVEKSLGLKTKKDIEKYGIASFNKKCRESVWQYKDEWERLTERIGFWLDLKNPYITYKNQYIESLWSILKIVWQKKLLYQGHKVVPWCTRCGTALSSHEIALGYREVTENSVYLKFRLRPGQKIGNNFKTDEKTFILSWTTTPWTLPGNVALAVGKNIKYHILSIENAGENYIAAEGLADRILNTKYRILNTFSGKDLISLQYEPLFNISALNTEKSYKVYPADFVETTEGTGVVHTAVMYGEDDYDLGKKVGLPQFHTVDEKGEFTEVVKEFAGLYVKAKGTEEKIIEYLKMKNYLLKIEPYAHEYPFCWRCSTPLLYYARDSWFIGMSKLRRKLIAANKKINWIPAYTKEGRFGNWLKEVKDWAISRERYWGTPLPIWACEKCDSLQVVGSVRELADLQGKAKNRYIFMRHGESFSNLNDTVNSRPADRDKYELTLRGRIEAEQTAKKLKKEKKIDIVISSDFRRTKETAEIVSSILGVREVKTDPRLREVNTGEFNGCRSKDYHNFFSSTLEKFTKRPPGGETLEELGKRILSLILDLEKDYKGRNFLLVSHEYPIWMAETVLRGWSEEESIREKEKRGNDFISTGKTVEIPFLLLPRNEWGFVDLHRPYIDEAKIKCRKCGYFMKRVKEVVDVWFDSGAMPFAQNHWPIEKRIDYPADYISEGVDQTRGWFYTLLAVGTLLGKGAPYKNVISLGLVLDKNGQKMSKSKGNTVDPWAMVGKYGADTVRWYFYTVNPPGEPKRFDERELGKTFRRFFLLLYNSFVFYRTYASKSFLKAKNYKLKANHVLDRWILSRLHETIKSTTAHLNKCEIGEAGRLIEELVEDLSRWYIRRSRRRFQPKKELNRREKLKDHENASAFLGYVILTIAKLIAPFTPFFAEALYQSLKHQAPGVKWRESMHLEDWPKKDEGKVDPDILAKMKEARAIASLILAKRAEAGIRVRQPLRTAKIKSKILEGASEILEVIKDEVNVKEIIVDQKISEAVWLDTTVTHELKEEGQLREIVRLVQDLRQDGGFRPQDKLIVILELPEALHYIVQKHENNFSKEVNAVVVEYKRSQKFDIELETKLDGQPIWLALRKPL